MNCGSSPVAEPVVEAASTAVCLWVVSDSAPAMTAALWLSRCPAGGASQLSRARVVCDAISAAADDKQASSVRAPLFSAVGALNPAFLSPLYESSSAACDPESDEPVPLPGDQASVSFGATFGSSGAGYITCEVLDVDVGSLARAVSVLAVTAHVARRRFLFQMLHSCTRRPVQSQLLTALPTHWPLFQDAVLIGQSGISRSARLGRSLDLTAALLSVACNGSSVGSSGANASWSSVNSTSIGESGKGCDKTCHATLSDALVSPAAVLAAVQTAWGSPTLPSQAAAPAFALTLAGSSLVVLRSSESTRAPFSNATLAWLGGARCEVAASSADGRWLLLQTPTPEVLCGSNTSACGYAAMALSNRAGGGGAEGDTGALPPYNTTVACPPFCPGSWDSTVAAPFAPSVPGVIALGSLPPSGSGGAPTLLPVDDSGSSSLGFFYTQSCSATGVFTDPTTSTACTTPSDPASYDCAYGTGDTCIRCPERGLCPGGSRLWPRQGNWVPFDAATEVVPCAPPDAEVRCRGWDVQGGRSACGAGYLQGSFLCGACASRYFLQVCGEGPPFFSNPYLAVPCLQDDGTCVSCPPSASAWDRYSGLLVLLGGKAAPERLFCLRTAT